MSKENPNFVKGLYVKRHQNAPSFVICNLGFKVEEFIVWLRTKQGGEYLNVDIKLSKAGDKYYAELNTYNPADKHSPNHDVEENQSQLNNWDKEEVIEYPKDESTLTEDQKLEIKEHRDAHNKKVEQANEDVEGLADKIPW